MVELLFFAVVTGFLIVRLNDVLGRRNGSEKQRSSEKSIFETVDAQAQEHSEVCSTESHPLNEEFKNVRKVYPDFCYKKFIDGAQKAFSMILEAFASDNREVLKTLLSKEMYSVFISSIDERKKNKETLEFTLVSMRPAEIKSVEITKSDIKICLEFTSEQTHVVKDSSGNVVTGSSEYSELLKDLWTFKRSLKSKSPTWLLAETETVE